jgi:hypothetical protein
MRGLVTAGRTVRLERVRGLEAIGPSIHARCQQTTASKAAARVHASYFTTPAGSGPVSVFDTGGLR